MPREADRVAEASTSTGTATMTLAGATTGHRTFASALGSTSTTIHYEIYHPTDGTWEVGVGTFLPGANAVQRDLVLSSSTGGGKVAFAAGTKIVYIPHPSETPIAIRARRPNDVGMELFPSSGQTAVMIRVAQGSGSDAFTVTHEGDIVAAGIASSPHYVATAGSPIFDFVEDDLAAPSGRWRMRSVGGAMEIARALTGEFTTSRTLVRLNQDDTVDIYGADLTPISGYADGAVVATINIPRAWQFRQRGAGGSSDLELGPIVSGPRFRVTSHTGASGFMLDPISRSFSLFGSDTSPFAFYSPGTEYRFNLGDPASIAARIIDAGSAATNAQAVMTREKGDARYALSSSSETLKLEIENLTAVDLSSLSPRSYVWNMDGHPRNGLQGAGFIYEEVSAVFPAATYPPVEDGPGGLDPLALLAGFVAEFRERIAAIETQLGEAS